MHGLRVMVGPSHDESRAQVEIPRAPSFWKGPGIVSVRASGLSVIWIVAWEGGAAVKKKKKKTC